MTSREHLLKLAKPHSQLQFQVPHCPLVDVQIIQISNDYKPVPKLPILPGAHHPYAYAKRFVARLDVSTVLVLVLVLISLSSNRHLVDGRLEVKRFVGLPIVARQVEPYL